MLRLDPGSPLRYGRDDKTLEFRKRSNDLQELTDKRHVDPNTGKQYLFTDNEINLMNNSKLSDIKQMELIEDKLTISFQDDSQLELSGRNSSNYELRGQRLIDLINQEENKDISLLNFLGNTARNPENSSFMRYAANAPAQYAKQHFEETGQSFTNQQKQTIMDVLLSNKEPTPSLAQRIASNLYNILIAPIAAAGRFMVNLFRETPRTSQNNESKPGSDRPAVIGSQQSADMSSLAERSSPKPTSHQAPGAESQRNSEELNNKPEPENTSPKRSPRR